MPLNTQSDSDKFCSHVCDPENDNCPMKVSFVKRRERRALPVLPVMEHSCCYLSDCLLFEHVCTERIKVRYQKTATGALWFCFKIAPRFILATAKMSCVQKSCRAPSSVDDMNTVVVLQRLNGSLLEEWRSGFKYLFFRNTRKGVQISTFVSS